MSSDNEINSNEIVITKNRKCSITCFTKMKSCLSNRYNNIKKLHRDRLKLVFTSGLSISDTYSDIYTVITYYLNGYNNWFYIGLSLIIIPQIIMGIRYYTAHRQTVSIKKKSIWLNMVAIILCVTPVATAYDGWENGTDPNNNLSKIKFLETILESYPQLVLQTYIFCYLQTGAIDNHYTIEKLIPMASSIFISISSIIWGIDMFIYKSNFYIRIVNITHLLCWLCRWIILATSFSFWAFLYIPLSNLLSLLYFTEDEIDGTYIKGFNFIIVSHIGFAGHDIKTATYFAIETFTFTPIILILSITNVLNNENNRLGLCDNTLTELCYSRYFILFTIIISIFYISLICLIKLKKIKLYVEKPYSLFQ